MGQVDVLDELEKNLAEELADALLAQEGLTDGQRSALHLLVTTAGVSSSGILLILSSSDDEI